MYNLTLLQYAASRHMITTFINKKNGLIIAVCGAGKTEMTFPLINKYYNSKKIAFAIPRVDIVKEIYDRICLEFSEIDIGVRYSGCIRNQHSQIQCLTTNQLSHYQNYFDIIIIDEVDAFPFDENEKFELIVNNSLKQGGSLFYLTSTPSESVLAKQFEVFTLYKRWHNFPLPLPKLIHANYKNYNRLNFKTHYILKTRKRPILVFVASITNGIKLQELLTKYKLVSEFTHSQDPKRNDKISKFRNSMYPILVTTTILERGVTFTDIDVLIYDSDHPHYNLAALIQISGRVGRKRDFQEGKVYFQYYSYTTIIHNSIAKLNSFNKKI